MRHAREARRLDHGPVVVAVVLVVREAKYICALDHVHEGLDDASDGLWQIVEGARGRENARQPIRRVAAAPLPHQMSGDLRVELVHRNVQRF